jgi:cytochrome c-type biogenesis protein CcmE
MGKGGEFSGEEVIAKHDENYEPPEVTDALAKAKKRTAVTE